MSRVSPYNFPPQPRATTANVGVGAGGAETAGVAVGIEGLGAGTSGAGAGGVGASGYHKLMHRTLDSVTYGAWSK